MKQQTKLNNNNKNTRLKLLKTNAAIWLDKMCKIKQLEPNYINIKINPLTPNDNCSSRTAPLTSKRCILYIYSTNTDTEYFKHSI